MNFASHRNEKFRYGILFFFVLSLANVALAEQLQVADQFGNLSVKISEEITFPVLKAGSLAWSPDNSVLAVESNITTLSTFNSRGQMLDQFKSHDARKLPLGNSLAFVNGAMQILFPVEEKSLKGASLDVRDIKTGHVVKTLNSGFLADGYAVSPNQKRVAVFCYLCRKIFVYNADTWKIQSISEVPLYSKKPLHGAVALGFFPDSKQLAVGVSNGHVIIIDTDSGSIVQDFVAYDSKSSQQILSAVAVSPSGDLVLAGQNDIRIFRASNGSRTDTMDNAGHAVTRGQALWDPKGRFIAFTDNNSLVIWQPMEKERNLLRFKFLGPSRKEYNVFTGKFEPTDTSFNAILTLALTRDGKKLAVAHGDNVTIFSIEDK